MIGETFGFSSEEGIMKHIKISISVAGKSDVFSIAAPNGHKIVCFVKREWSSIATATGYFVQITFITENNCFSIGRNCGITNP